MKSTSQGTSMLAHQVGEEEHRALEHADEQQVAARVVRARSRAPSCAHALLQLVGLDEDLADRRGSRIAARRLVTRARGRRALEAQHAVLDDRARAVAQVEHAAPSPGRRARGSSASAPAAPGRTGRRRRPRRGAARRAARARAAAPRRCSTRDRGRGRRARVVDDVVEHLGLVAQQLARCAATLRLGGRVQRAQRRQQPVRARGRGRSASVVVASRPRATPGRARAQHAAVSSRRRRASSGRTSRPSRAGIPSSARRPGEEASR